MIAIAVGGPVAEGGAEGSEPSALAVATAGRAVGGRPPAGDGTWQDWPEEVWVDIGGRTDPITWNMARAVASKKCRELRLPYGRESQVRFRKFEALTSERFGPGWRIAAQRQEIITRQRLELRRAEMEALLETVFDVLSEGTGGPLGVAAAAGAEAGLEAWAAGKFRRSRFRLGSGLGRRSRRGRSVGEMKRIRPCRLERPARVSWRIFATGLE